MKRSSDTRSALFRTMTGFENETHSEDEQPCHIERLSDEDLKHIFFFIDIEDRFLYLETVSKRWMAVMPYSDWREVDFSKFHQDHCQLGGFCHFEASKRYPSSYRKSLYSFLSKALNSLIGRCSHFIRTLNLSGLAINEEIVMLLKHFSKLENINLTKCFFAPTTETWLLEKPRHSLIIHGTEADKDTVLNHIDVSDLSISENFEFNSFEHLHKLESLTISHSLITYSNLACIFQNCNNLTSFNATNVLGISYFCAQAMKTPIAGRLKFMSLSMHSHTLFSMLDYFTNLSELILLTPKNERQITYLEPLLSLSNLQALIIRCKKVTENDLLCFIYQSLRLQKLEIKAKKIYDDSNALDVSPPVSLSLQYLKLSLVSIFESARIATNIIRISPQLKQIKLMKRKLKAPFRSEDSLYDNCLEFEDYYRNVFHLCSLQSFTLPFITTDNCRILMERFKDMPLKKLMVYGGYTKMDNLRQMENLIRFQCHSLVSLQCGPYVKVSGLENLLCHLPNLEKISFHIHTTCSWNVLRAIGKHPKLKQVDLRSCDDYFFGHIHFELSTLIISRRTMKSVRNHVSFKPLFINAWSSLRHLSLPLNTEQVLDDLLIRFKFFFDSN